MTSTAGRSATRQRLMEAGFELLRASGGAVLRAGITVELIASRSGLSVQTFYKHYPSSVGGKDGYLAELLVSLPVQPSWSGIQTQAKDRRGANTGSRSSTRTFAAELFVTLTDSGDPHMRRLALVFAPESRRLSARVRAAYQAMDAQLGSELRSLIRNQGVPRLRQPFTYESVAVLLIALAEGFDVRRHYDASAASTLAFSEAVVALVAAVTDRDDRHSHIDDPSPSASTDLPMGSNPYPAEDLPDDPEQAVIDAAATEFAQRGYFATTQDHIARRAEVPLSSLRALFPSNVDIVVAALAPTVAVLRRRTENDLRLGRSPRDIISSFPARMAEQIIGHRSFVDAMALVLSLHGAQAQVDATHIRDELFFPGAIMGCIAEGQRAGQVMNGLDATDLAVTLTNNVIFRCLSRRQETAADVGDAINRMFLPVLFAVDEPQPATPDAEDRTA